MRTFSIILSSCAVLVSLLSLMYTWRVRNAGRREVERWARRHYGQP